MEMEGKRKKSGKNMINELMRRNTEMGYTFTQNLYHGSGDQGFIFRKEKGNSMYHYKS